MNSVMYTSVHCECVVSANGCIMVGLSLPCCCCTIHLVFGSTTDKHFKLKKVLLMRISHYNDSVPLWEEFTENTAELGSCLDDVWLSLPERGSHADG